MHPCSPATLQHGSNCLRATGVRGFSAFRFPGVTLPLGQQQKPHWTTRVIVLYSVSDVARLLIQNSNVVIVGAWNPAIITPIWLRQQFPEFFPGDQYQAQFIAGPAVSVRFTVNDLQIDPSNGRLVLSCAIDDQGKFESLPRLATAISERLPHTPVAAVGFNFVFEAAQRTVLAIDQFLDEQRQDRFYTDLGLTSRIERRVTHAFALPQSTLNLTYEYKPERTTLVFNFHYNVTNSQQVRDALASFAEVLSEARRLADAIDPRNNR